MSSESEVALDRRGSTRVLSDVARAGGLALVASWVVNVAVTTVGRQAGIGEGLMAMTYPSVLVLTTVGVVGATVVYAVLARLTDRPDRNFLVVAAIVLVLSIVPDFTYIPGEPGGSVTAGVVLATMHVLTAAIAVWFLVDRRSLARS